MFLSKNLHEGLTAKMSADSESARAYIQRNFSSDEQAEILRLYRNVAFRINHREHAYSENLLLWDAIEAYRQGERADPVRDERRSRRRLRRREPEPDDDDDDVVFVEVRPPRHRRRREPDPDVVIDEEHSTRIPRRSGREGSGSETEDPDDPPLRRRHVALERGERGVARRTLLWYDDHLDPISRLGAPDDTTYPFQFAMNRERRRSRRPLKAPLRIGEGPFPLILQNLNTSLFNTTDAERAAMVRLANLEIRDPANADVELRQVPEPGVVLPVTCSEMVRARRAGIDAGMGLNRRIAHAWVRFVRYYMRSVDQPFLPHKDGRLAITAVDMGSLSEVEWTRICRNNDEILTYLVFSVGGPIIPTFASGGVVGTHMVMLRLRKKGTEMHWNGMPVFEVDVYDSSGIIVCPTFSRHRGFRSPYLVEGMEFSDGSDRAGLTIPFTNGRQYYCMSFLQVVLNDFIYPPETRLRLQQVLGLSRGWEPLTNPHNERVQALLDQELILVHPLFYQADPRVGDSGSCVIYSCYCIWYFATQQEARRIADLGSPPHVDILEFRDFILDTLSLVHVHWDFVIRWHREDNPRNHRDGTNGFGKILYD